MQRAVEAPDGFDARFSAIWRRYAYRVADRPEVVDPLRRGQVLARSRPVDEALMNAAALALLGEHDFAAFCKQREGATTIRNLIDLRWEREPDGLLVAHVRADAFCHSMVRSLVGCLLAVGEGRRSVDWAAEVLAAERRDSAVAVAPAHGLTLEEVGYPPDAELGGARRGHQGAAWLSDEHYFSADPSVPFRRMPVTASVWGHSLSLDSGSGVFAQGRRGRRHGGAVPRDLGTRGRAGPRPRLRVRRDRAGHRRRGAGRHGDRGRRERAGGAAGQRERRRARRWPTGSPRPPRPAYPRTRRTTSSGRTRRSGSGRPRCTSCCSRGCPGWCPAAARCWSSARTWARTRCSAGWGSRATRPSELRVRRGSGCWRLSARDHSVGGP